MDWIRNEQTGLVYLIDIRKMVLAKTSNKPFTNSLFRHMKRNLVAILDEEAKENHLNKIKGQREFLALTYGGGKSSLMLPPRHRFAGAHTTERKKVRARMRSVVLTQNQEDFNTVQTDISPKGLQVSSTVKNLMRENEVMTAASVESLSDLKAAKARLRPQTAKLARV